MLAAALLLLLGAPPSAAEGRDLVAEAHAKASQAAQAVSGYRREALAREAESLYVAAIERDCAARVTVPYLEPWERLSRERYLKAWNACSAAYQAGSADREANLALLYERLDDPKEGPARLAAALAIDKGNPAALAYLADLRMWNKAVFGDDVKLRLNLTLRQVEMDGPGAVDAKRGLLRITYGSERFVEAFLAASKFGNPEFELAKVERSAEGGLLDELQRWARSAPSAPDRAAAYDALAGHYLSTGNYAAAADASLSAVAEPLTAADRAYLGRLYGRLYGVERAGEEALKRLDFKTAVKLLDLEQFEAARQQLSRYEWGEASYRIDQKDNRGALASLERLRELQPGSTDYLSLWALLSLRSDRYSDAVAGFTRLETLAGLKPRERLWKAEAVLRGGHYEEAFALLGDLYREQPERETFAWQLAAGYGAFGGDWLWGVIADASKQTDEAPQAVRDEYIDAVWTKLGRAARAADKANAGYAAIEHYSALTAFVVDLGSAKCRYCAEKPWIEEQKTKLGDRAMALYRSLKVKPLPGPRVVARAEAASRAAVAGDSWSGEELYRSALDLAPWWPEGWYNYGLLVGLQPGRYPWAARIMGYAADLTADESLAKRAREKAEHWRSEWTRLGCSEEDFRERRPCDAFE
ncbi:MAG: hypothetical protein HY553_22435 [Elusimicrobia bacterium]|nr:hypothetical protein [Elusimicrobiota bacterium]